MESGLVVTEKEREAMNALDKAAEEVDGFVDSIGINYGTHYDYRKLNDYCKKKGIEPIDLTEHEVRQFMVLDIGGGKHEQRTSKQRSGKNN